MQANGPHSYPTAIAAFDRANGEDTNREIFNGKEYPKELLYAERMGAMLQRYLPDATEAVKLAVRAQHIQRWKIPRGNYPAGRIGYLQWRTRLYKFHAEIAGELMRQAGYDDDMISRVKNIVSKKALKTNAETQLLEDVAGLVFLEHYLSGFAAQHPEYDQAKWIQILRKTWRKMSADAHEFVFSGKINLPESLMPLILKAVRQQ